MSDAIAQQKEQDFNQKIVCVPVLCLVHSKNLATSVNIPLYHGKNTCLTYLLVPAGFTFVKNLNFANLCSM
jgi:hypothetical protein